MRGLIAVAGLTLLGAGAATAQEFEPLPRAPGVRFPAELAAEAAARTPALPGRIALADGAATGAEVGGAIRILAIPALFEDSPEPAVAAAQVESLLFGETGRTLTTFYEQMSGGRLRVTGTVPEWVRTHVPRLDAAGSVEGHGWIGERANEHFLAALEAADPTVDFTLYDNDGPDGVPDSGDDDGYVDALTFKFTEVAGSCGGPGFWPHASALRDATGQFGVDTEDMGRNGRPIQVLRYTTESVIECDGQTPQGPATMAHEFGHTLGLPDFYRAVEGIEANQRHWMVGCFGLMAAGSWGCGSDTRVWGFGPTGMSPLSRIMLGWATVTEVGEVRDSTFILEPVQSSQQLLKVRLRGDGTEYYLIEYRPQVGFDDALPAGGVMVYHVDENANIWGGAYAPTFPYWLVEADASGALRRTLLDDGDRGVPGDVFARGAATDSLTPATVPATALASGEASTVWIHAIAVADGTAAIRLSTTTALDGVPVAVPTYVPALSRVAIRYRIQGGSPPYTAIAPPDGMPVAGLEIRMEGDEVVIDGVPLLGGRTVRLPIHVRDSAGEPWYRTVPVEFGDVDLSDDELLAPLVAPSAADQDIRTYLDRSGNADGSYDLGDLRAYLQRRDG